MSGPGSIPILQLPGEVRNIIYTLYFDDFYLVELEDYHLDDCYWLDLVVYAKSLLTTNKQIRAEVRACLFHSYLHNRPEWLSFYKVTQLRGFLSEFDDSQSDLIYGSFTFETCDRLGDMCDLIDNIRRFIAKEDGFSDFFQWHRNSREEEYRSKSGLSLYWMCQGGNDGSHQHLAIQGPIGRLLPLHSLLNATQAYEEEYDDVDDFILVRATKKDTWERLHAKKIVEIN